MSTTTTTTFRGDGLAPGLKFFTKEYGFAELLDLYTTAPELIPVKAGHAIQVLWQNTSFVPGTVAYDFPVMSGNWSLGNLVDIPSKGSMTAPTIIWNQVRNHGQNTGLLNDQQTYNIAWSVSGTPITVGNGILTIRFGYKYLPIPMASGQTFN